MTDQIATLGGAEDVAEHPVPKPFHWVYQIWLKPGRVFSAIAQQENGVWLLPLGLLSVLQIIKSIIEGPIRSAAAQAAQATAGMPAMDMGYLTDQEIAQIQQGAATTNGPFFTIFIPAFLSILGIWISWVLLGSILHLGLTLAGNRNNAGASMNLSAWASLPFAIRMIVQIIATAATRQVIDNPGLSGFLTPQGNFAIFVTVVLSLLDIYLIWQVVYLIIGSWQMGNIARNRAIITVIVSVFIVLLLQAVPGTISQVISGMSFTRPYFF